MRPIKCRFRDVSRVEISDFASLNSEIQMEPGEEGGKKNNNNENSGTSRKLRNQSNNEASEKW